MSIVLFVHLISIGIWAGCVATEVVCELSQKNIKYSESYIASLHWNIDRFVEIPAIITTITGGILLQTVTFTPLITLKVTAGICAVVLNSFAAYTVYMRCKYYSEKNENGYMKYHRLHEQVGIGCVLALIVAIGSGGVIIAG